MTDDRTTSRSRAITLEWCAVTLLAIALSVVYTYPLCLHPETLLTDRGDPMQHLNVSYWTSAKLLSGHWAGFWSLPPIFYPVTNALTYGDPQLGTTLLGLPLFAATHNIVLAYNFVVLIALPLCAIGAYALARHLTSSRGAGLIAMMVWGFGAWHTGQADHQQLLSLEFLPFLLLCLHRYGETKQRRWLAGLGVCWLVQEFLSEYWAAFLLLLIFPTALFILVYTYRHSRRELLTAGGVILLAVTPWLIWQRPLFAAAHSGHRHPRAEIDHYSCDLADYLPAPHSMLWGRFGFDHLETGEILPSGEYMVSPGVIALILSAIAGVCMFQRRTLLESPPTFTESTQRVQKGLESAGLALLIVSALLWLALVALGSETLEVFHIPAWLVNDILVQKMGVVAVLALLNRPLVRGLRSWSIRHEARFPAPYLALAVGAAIWSCGYEVYAFRHEVMSGVHGYLTWLPGARSLRGLCRMGIFADLAFAVVAAYGYSLVRQASARKGVPLVLIRSVTVVLCILIWMEAMPKRGTVYAYSQPVPLRRAVDAWLARQPRGPLLELPLSVHPYLEGERLWHEIVNGMPMRNGCETFYPPNYYKDVVLLVDPGAAESVARLRELGIRYVLLDTDNAYANQHTPVHDIPPMPPSLPPPYQEAFRDKNVIAYVLPRLSF